MKPIRTCSHLQAQRAQMQEPRLLLLPLCLVPPHALPLALHG